MEIADQLGTARTVEGRAVEAAGGAIGRGRLDRGILAEVLRQAVARDGTEQDETLVVDDRELGGLRAAVGRALRDVIDDALDHVPVEAVRPDADDLAGVVLDRVGEAHPARRVGSVNLAEQVVSVEVFDERDPVSELAGGGRLEPIGRAHVETDERRGVERLAIEVDAVDGDDLAAEIGDGHQAVDRRVRAHHRVHPRLEAGRIHRSGGVALGERLDVAVALEQVPVDLVRTVEREITDGGEGVTAERRRGLVDREHRRGQERRHAGDEEQDEQTRPERAPHSAPRTRCGGDRRR